MANIDLDQIEQEVSKGRKRNAITFKGQRFVLPSTLPLRFGVSLAKGDIEGALRSVLDGKLDEFLDLGASLDGFSELANQIALLYTGREVPESPASGSSSRRSSRPSKRTGSVSTT